MYIQYVMYIYTCVYLVRVDLDIILLVVSNGDDSAKGWRSVFENLYLKPPPPPHWARMFASHASLPGSSNFFELFSYILPPHCSTPGRKMFFWRGKNRHFEPKGVDLCPPRGVCTGRGKEWECNVSRKCSRNDSQELWELKSHPWSQAVARQDPPL